MRARSMRRGRLMKQVRETRRTMVLARMDKTIPAGPRVTLIFKHAWRIQRGQ